MTTTNWRDLATELTAKQIASMEDAEAMMPAGRPDTRQKLLEFARDFAAGNLADAAYAEIPAPPGAKVGVWEQNTAGGYSRSLEWGDVTTGVAGVDVGIDGRQEGNGDFTRSVTVYVDGSVRLSAVEAREVARALLAAAEEFDRLNGDAPPFA